MRLALSSRPDTRKFPFVPTAHRRPEPRGGLRAQRRHRRAKRRRRGARERRHKPRRRRRQSGAFSLFSFFVRGPSSSVSRVSRVSRVSKPRSESPPPSLPSRVTTILVGAIASSAKGRNAATVAFCRATTAAASSLSRASALVAAAQNLSPSAAATTSARRAACDRFGAAHRRARRSVADAHAGPSARRNVAQHGERPIPKIPFREIASRSAAPPPSRAARGGGERAASEKNAASARSATGTPSSVFFCLSVSRLKPRTRTRSRRRRGDRVVVPELERLERVAEQRAFRHRRRRGVGAPRGTRTQTRRAAMRSPRVRG